MSEPLHRSRSYRPATCCRGTHCALADRATDEQPCWGEVAAAAESMIGEDDFYWIHACEGHAAQADPVDIESPYTPEPL